jgi:hypothetical protein
MLAKAIMHPKIIHAYTFAPQHLAVNLKNLLSRLVPLCKNDGNFTPSRSCLRPVQPNEKTRIHHPHKA